MHKQIEAGRSESIPFVSLLPYVLDNIGNDKISKTISKVIAASLVVKWGYNLWAARNKKDEFTTVYISEDQPFYDYVVRWITTLSVKYDGNHFEFIDYGKQKEIVPIAPQGTIQEIKKEEKSFDFIPSGRSSTKVKDIPVFIEHEFSDYKDGKRMGKNKILISMKTHKKSELKEIFEEIERIGNMNAAQPKSIIYTYKWHWRQIKKYMHKRNVVLPNGEFQRVLKDINVFLNSKDWYESVQVPWRRGYLLHGIPGAGKGTTVQAISTHLGLDVYTLNLSEISDDDLIGSVSEIPERAILLLEDIDCCFTQREAKGTTQATMSGLLNALDGIAVPEGRITFMTTNHIENLDKALTRAGRVDYKIEYKNAVKEQIVDLAQKFGYNSHEANDLGSEWELLNISMAEVQNKFQILRQAKQNNG